jgi:hypothetical protein
VSGLDDDSLMGVDLTKVKKRHYKPFAAMLVKLIKAAYSVDFEFETKDK